MKKNRTSKSGFFITRVVVAFVLCSVSAVIAALALAAPTLAQKNVSSAKKFGASNVSSNWQEKVDSGVLAKAAVGPTEFIVYMAQQADLSGAAALTTKEEKGTYVYQRLTSVAEATQPPVRLLLTQLGADYKAFWISNAISTKGDLAVIQAMASLPEVAAIQPIGKGALQLPPEENTPSSANRSDSPASPDAIEAVEPGLARVNADDVWALGYEGHGAVVCGSDTGVRFTHNALRNQYRGWGGSAAASNHDYNWHDAIHLPNWPVDPTNPCNPAAGQPSPLPCDDNSHGSHTVGTMVGDDGGANQVGMAPQAKWIACRNMSGGFGIIPTYLECMQWIIAPTKVDGTNPDPTKAPHVINNSWGCVEGCPAEPVNPLRDSLQASRAAGIVYVASAGNDAGCGTIQHPLARYPEAFTVGNTTHTTDVIATTSSRGPSAVDPDNPTSPIYTKPNISAPGSTIRSSNNANDADYGNKSGTSMAGPHVAGLVALIISANPMLAGNVDRIEDTIEQTAAKKMPSLTELCAPDSTTSVPNNTYGWGRIDALNAVTLALEDAVPVQLVGVESRKRHGSPGTDFDINLPLTDPIGIECRNGQPAEGNHTIVFTFVNPLTNVGNATVESGNGFVTSKGIGADPHEYIVTLGGVTNAQTLRLTLSAITDNAGNSTPSLSVSIGFLLGDTTEDRFVNSADISQTKSESGQVVDESNFRTDVNTDNFVNSGDISMVKSQSGTALP